ncbi:hypothetical protein DMB95_06610 [Campylobacter sp. MIT 12-8780]|uniref:hypothetical protein n=1 Tax=unclassified Campylobacter TaxID=2593542 RepID=UPI00115EA369|nr:MULTISPECIES: hypothetical protein [unclassified Campylobacter]NDJ27636.1 hypothetical protein [Campylobacter sp. MIT 19-121]TQR40803.1 hypothetical protein DMB95_06610 [Campylobacter sp. MIT 12-8780]
MFNKIYENHKKIVWVIFLSSLFACISVLYILFYCSDILQKDINEYMKGSVSNIITFMSICFGFYLTSLSILFSSKYLKKLYTEDHNKPTQRKIHTLKEYFQLAVYCALLTVIVSFIVLLILVFQNKWLSIFAFSLLMSIFVENFLFLFLLLKIFLNALVIQAMPEIQEK